MPKLPPPPPWQAQNRSGRRSSATVRRWPSAVTSSTDGELVARQAVQAADHALAPAQRQPGDADGRARAGGDRYALAR